MSHNLKKLRGHDNDYSKRTTTSHYGCLSLTLKEKSSKMVNWDVLTHSMAIFLALKNGLYQKDKILSIE